jgi:heat shock protein HslJ
MKKKIIHWNCFCILCTLVNACSTFQYEKTNSLIPTKWRLLSVRINTKNSFANFQLDNCPVLTIGRGEFKGFSGCNGFQGKCRIDGISIEFTNLSLTRKMCSPEKMEIEKLVTTALRSVDNYSIEGGRRLILKEGSNVLMIYTEYLEIEKTPFRKTRHYSAHDR